MSLNFLALDTSTEACSVALFCDGQLIKRYHLLARQHNRLLLPMLEEVLAEAGITRSAIDVLAFGVGPGSFTGLRIAASVVQSIAFVYDLPVVLVSTLRALAKGVHREFGAAKVLSAIDACVNEIYWGAYKIGADGTLLEIIPEQVNAPEMVEVLADLKDCIGVGSGWDVYHPILEKKLEKSLLKWIPQRHPNAQDILELAKIDYQQGKIVAAKQALPIYLRDNITRKSSYG